MSSRLQGRIDTLWRAATARLLTLRRRRKPVDPERILVAHRLLLGDTLMLTPLLAKIRERWPDAGLVMTMHPGLVPLYAARPYGTRPLAFEPKEPATLNALWREGAHAGGFDLALVPGDNRYSWLAAAMGARWIVAFSGDRPAYKSWPVDELRDYPATPTAWGDAVAGLIDGIEPRPYSPADWPAPAAAAFSPPAAPYAVLHVGASSPLKLWSPQRWMALAERLEQAGLRVVWSGGRGEQPIVDSIDPHQSYPSYAERLDLAQLWHLLAGAALIVCPDTGVAHLGRIVGTPTLTLFGPGSATICGPGRFWRDAPYIGLGEEPFECRDQHLLFKREIGWVQRCGRSTRECPHPRCMDRLDLDRVFRAAVALQGRSARIA